jgi:ribosomal-protein-serine acetyltransferase
MLPIELPGGFCLRYVEEGDAEAIYGVVHANRAHLGEWLPWVPYSSLESIADFIGRARRQAEDDNGFQAVIEDPSGGVAGFIGFHAVDWNNRATSLGYWLVADQQGRGTMTEAVRALTALAFDEWQLNRVEIRVAPGNEWSAAIPERLGFVKEGVLRQAERHGDRFEDSVVYSMLAAEWS